MSIRAIDWAFKQNVKWWSHKFVLVTLADYAGDTGLAFPSTETISRKTGFSRRNTIRILHRLVEQGWIEDTGQRVGRTKKIKVYHLKKADDTNLKGDNSAPLKGDNSAPLKGDNRTPFNGDIGYRNSDIGDREMVTTSHPDPLEDPSEEPAPCRPPDGGQQANTDLIEDFAEAKWLICKHILKGKNPNRQWSYDAEANLARQLPIPRLEIERVSWFRGLPADGSPELEMRKQTTETGLMAYWGDEVTRAEGFWQKLYGWREKKKAAG